MKSDDDQEVAGIFHALDDAELEVEPLAVVVLGEAGGEAVRSRGGARAPPRRCLRSTAASSSLADREARQDRLGRARPEGAALRDLDRVLERLGQIGEQRRHLGAGLEAVLGRELAALGLGDQLALGDADQRVVRLVVGGGGEERLVGRDQRQAVAVGEIDQRRLGALLGRRAVALQLDIEPVAEQAHQGLEPRAPRDGSGRPAIAASSGPSGPPVSAIRPVGLAVEPVELEARRLVRRRFEEGARVEPHQAAVALLARGQQHDARALRRDTGGRAAPWSVSAKSMASAQPTIGWMP